MPVLSLLQAASQLQLPPPLALVTDGLQEPPPLVDDVDDYDPEVRWLSDESESGRGCGKRVGSGL